MGSELTISWKGSGADKQNKTLSSYQNYFLFSALSNLFCFVYSLKIPGGAAIDPH